ncbi:hypothetical protein GX586_10275, partial [bacterium]|nr:hypothetical protein [bacterium]
MFAIILACSVSSAAWYDTLWGSGYLFTGFVDRVTQNFTLLAPATNISGFATSSELTGATGVLVTAAELIGATNPLASRAYVDAATNAASVVDRVLKSGDTMGGPLRVSDITSTQDEDGVSTTLSIHGYDGIAGGGVEVRSGNTEGPSIQPRPVVIRGGVCADGSLTGQVILVNV